VVKQANGSIRVESEPGQGARFTIDLPAEQTRMRREAPAARSARVGRPGGDAPPHEAEAPLSVLVVEDEGAVRRVTVRSLAHLGYRVFEAEGGQEALDILEREPVDIVLSDVMMPGMTGPQLVGEMRRAEIHVPVLLMSGYPGDEQGRRDRLPILRKPFTREALVAALHEALAEDPGEDPARPAPRDPPA
jgi:two-component system cell cycle sensor histidine kinase/response regulator CckA